jgi:DNA-binding NtrC family response regulator
MSNRVLVVDDQPRVLASMARCLRLAGFQVESAQSSKDALALCDEYSFDVVVLDFIMPGINGVELLARIRKIRPLVRAVVISGQIDDSLGEKEVAKRLRESVEADEFLNKPVSCTSLVATISNLLAAEPSADWRNIAKKMVNGKSSSIKKAKTVAGELKKFRKK